MFRPLRGLIVFRSGIRPLYNIRTLCATKGYFQRNLDFINKTRTPILYGDEASPPVRFVQITASILNYKTTFRKIDLFNGENKTEFYRQINPLQKVPALSVPAERFMILDSHAIALFMCQKANEQTLYPANIFKRNKVDQLLFFNASALFPVDSLIFSDYFAGKWPAEEQHIIKWHFLLEYLENILETNVWLTGDEETGLLEELLLHPHPVREMAPAGTIPGSNFTSERRHIKVTLGDICCATTVSSIQLLIPTLDKYHCIKKWMNKLEQIPNFRSINKNGLERLKSYIEKMKIQ